MLLDHLQRKLPIRLAATLEFNEQDREAVDGFKDLFGDAWVRDLVADDYKHSIPNTLLGSGPIMRYITGFDRNEFGDLFAVLKDALKAEWPRSPDKAEAGSWTTSLRFNLFITLCTFANVMHYSCRRCLDGIIPH